MKLRIARYLLTAVGMTGLAGTPALFADDLHRDIRADRYRAAARVRADIRRDERRRHDWR